MNIGVADAAGTTTIVTGRFLSNGRARGTLRYRGPGPYKGCNADGVWTAHAWPLPPPVEHFTGKTDRGTRVTFERTKERHPRVTAFSFGSLTHASGLQCGFEPVRTGGLEPPWYQFALPVNHGRFSGQYNSWRSSPFASADASTRRITLLAQSCMEIAATATRPTCIGPPTEQVRSKRPYPEQRSGPSHRQSGFGIGQVQYVAPLLQIDQPRRHGEPDGRVSGSGESSRPPCDRRGRRPAVESHGERHSVRDGSDATSRASPSRCLLVGPGIPPVLPMHGDRVEKSRAALLLAKPREAPAVL